MAPFEKAEPFWGATVCGSAKTALAPPFSTEKLFQTASLAKPFGIKHGLSFRADRKRQLIN